ncbi:hypothetical protein [Burkholderia ubonensis]|uniref:hypothetical protein n=1 Tax=Burkholderia ubonensis TaxID=101571 RepID=UPI0012FF5BB8|nr:hypothetical protein [Burkholderia ubonensis]
MRNKYRGDQAWQGIARTGPAAPLAKTNGAAHGPIVLHILSGWRRSRNPQAVIHSAKYR